MALTIARLVIDIWQTEMKALVRANVIAEIMILRTSELTEDLTSAAVKTSNLKKWLACKYQFNYKDQSYYHLIRALIADKDLLPLGLPKGTVATMSRKNFVKEMLHQATKSKPAAPLLKKGPLLPLIQDASKEIARLCSILQATPQDKQSWTMDALLFAVQDAQILFAPWIPLPNTHGGRPASKPSHLAWISFSTPPPPNTISSSSHLLRIDPAEVLTSQLSALSQRTQSDDANGHWSAVEIRLCDLPSIFHKTVPPDEWCIFYVTQAQQIYGPKGTAADSLVSETYTWAFNVFDMNNPVHRLALYTSIIVSKMLPNIFNPFAGPRVPAPPLAKTATVPEILRSVREVDLCDVPRNGHGEAAPFIFMVTMYCIAWTYQESPLRKYVRNSSGFGEPWANKHSTFHPFYSIFSAVFPHIAYQLSITFRQQRRNSFSPHPVWVDRTLGNHIQIASPYAILSPYPS